MREANPLAVDLPQNTAPLAAMQLLPLKICEKFLVAPVAVERDVLVIKAARPLNLAQKTVILEACATRVRSLRIVPVDVAEARQSLRRVAAEGAVLEPVLHRLRADDLSGSQLKAAISAMLTEALRLRASDIHLDARPDPDSWISYRIDSDLQQKHQIPERLMRALFMRIKTPAWTPPTAAAPRTAASPSSSKAAASMCVSPASRWRSARPSPCGSSTRTACRAWRPCSRRIPP
jgi:type II secretory ATPase GspE/PulE/Tfp pilus assembly ATPase PilB-like protein